MTRYATSDWTYSEYARLPDDGNKYEVIDGEVCMTPAPGMRHQKVAAELYLKLDAYVKEHGIGEMYWDVDLLFQPGQFLRPDMLFVPTASLGGLTDRGVESPPGLVVEVVSKHSGPIDRLKKAPRYRAFGIQQYWVVDPSRRTVEVFRPRQDTPVVHDEVVRWQPETDLPALEIDLKELFGES